MSWAGTRPPSAGSRAANASSSTGDDAAACFPFAAQQQAVARRARLGRGKLAADPEMRAFVAERLGTKRSPKQIAHALRQAFREQPACHLLPETIYQTIYEPARRSRAAGTGCKVTRP